ncbi:DUF4325 domain-containing protein [Nibribacter ruber]|uniref:DUF4325 domain-containing protein n=1 Tax=Nibribacter ruber TaxID=2698458 RepID=A0A6P1P1L6_9BACT|nr:DUF4325 domain-containing protein [Nibribacter ruber]QHL87452.1 DUF4325 domain-containing protein [Nibribacter ruber]
MKTLSLDNFAPIISDRLVGDEIYNLIKSDLETCQQLDIDLKEIKSMATFCAKQIFGKLYLELGGDSFFQRIRLINATDDLKTIIRIGIQSALEDR